MAAGTRGPKAGEFLLAAVIARAAETGAERHLLSNRKVATAIYLHEKLGFVHDEGVMAKFVGRHAGATRRCCTAPPVRTPAGRAGLSAR